MIEITRQMFILLRRLLSVGSQLSFQTLWMDDVGWMELYEMKRGLFIGEVFIAERRKHLLLASCTLTWRELLFPMQVALKIHPQLLQVSLLAKTVIARLRGI